MEAGISSKRFLITTAIETSWKDDRPVMFLGEWCRLYLCSENWRELEHKVHHYHWDDREKYYQDYLNLSNIYEEKLQNLSACLNNIHGVTLSDRYWRIVVGPWLRFFIDAVYDRFELIRTVSEIDEVDDTCILKYELKDWIPKDFSEFYNQFTEDAWNHIVFAEFIKAIGLPHTFCDSFLESNIYSIPARKTKRKLVNIIHDCYARFLPSRFNRVSMIASYMPLGKLYKLQRSLGQLPYFKSPSLSVSNQKNEISKRNMIVMKRDGTVFDSVLNELIINMIPKAYIENYEDLVSEALKKLPSDPGVIFTANAYQGDDGFKIWSAQNANKGVPLVIEQHGGNFGIARLNQMEDHQIAIADTFATWGWKSNENVRPMPALKLTETTPSIDDEGEVLITMLSLPRYFYSHLSFPVAGQYLDYIDEQLRFINSVRPNLKNYLRIRLDPLEFGWEIAERLKSSGVGRYIDDSKKSDLATRLNGCRLSVSTYNATVFLETLAANFPTLVYFNPNWFEIRPEAKPIMESLRKVGILHDTPESAAEMLNTIGDNISDWWFGTELQETRRIFCFQYARVENNWCNTWKVFFNSIIKQ